MKDKQFGKMQWVDEHWETSAKLDQFSGFGDKTFVDDTRTDPMDPDVLYKSGKFRIKIDTRGDRIPPAASQRAAWQALVDRGKGLADELLRLFADEYQIQRPTRVKWWRAMYGDIPYEQRMPDTLDPAEIKRLIRPFSFQIHAEDKGKGTAEIAIFFFCTWHSEGLGAVIANGAVVEAGGSYVALREMQQVTAEFVHPVLGKLRRLAKKPALLGWVQLRCFQEFYAIAQARQEFRETPDRVGPPRSKILWSFARGEFALWVYAKPDGLPTDAQVAAVTAFKAHESENAAAVIRAIFEEYQRTWKQRRAVIQGKEPYIDAVLPKLDNPDGLREIIQFNEVRVFPDTGSGPVDLGLVFSAAGVGFGVRWREGRVEAIGLKKVGHPVL